MLQTFLAYCDQCSTVRVLLSERLFCQKRTVESASVLFTPPVLTITRVRSAIEIAKYFVRARSQMFGASFCLYSSRPNALLLPTNSISAMAPISASP